MKQKVPYVHSLALSLFAGPLGLLSHAFTASVTLLWRRLQQPAEQLTISVEETQAPQTSTRAQ